MALTQAQFDLDPTLVAKAMSLLTPAANDADIDDIAQIEKDALAFEIEHGGFYV
jgi:hypothetical protein